MQDSEIIVYSQPRLPAATRQFCKNRGNAKLLETKAHGIRDASPAKGAYINIEECIVLCLYLT